MTEGQVMLHALFSYRDFEKGWIEALERVIVGVRGQS
jgi:hypothetical protein